MFYLCQITTPNQKIYIGITDNPKRRWNDHSKPSTGSRSAIATAIQKYGKENVKFEILQTFNSEKEVLEAEAKIVDEDFSENNSQETLKRDNWVRNPKVVLFNNETFASYLTACKKYNLTKDELLKCRQKLGRDHVTLEEVLNLRVGKKPIEIDGIRYSSRVEAKHKTGLSMYKILEIAKGASSQHLKKKQVAMICLKTHQILQIFETMTQAAKFIKAASASKICMCCKGQRQQAYGYKWSYWEDSFENSDSR